MEVPEQRLLRRCDRRDSVSWNVVKTLVGVGKDKRHKDACDNETNLTRRNRNHSLEEKVRDRSGDREETRRVVTGVISDSSKCTSV